MIEPPVAPPPGFSKAIHFSKKKVGDALLINEGGWKIRFENGQLKICAPDGIHVVFYSYEETERFLDVIRAVDAGRYEVTWGE